MTATNSGVPLGAWLADQGDDMLVRLLQMRPDLSQPPPGTIAALASRATSRQSIKAAGDSLDFLRLAVLDALLVLHADATAVAVSEVTDLLGERADEGAVRAALDDLRERALVWGADAVRVSLEVAAALPWFAGQAVSESTARSADEITELVAGLDQAQRDLLDRLLEGSPMGRTRDAAPETPPDRPVQRLLTAGLLHRLDDETVILPRLVGQALRGEVLGPVDLTQPDPTVRMTAVADVDAAAAGAAIDLLRETELLLEALGATPIPELRNGGLGVREVKRLAKSIGVDEHRLGLLLELAAGAGLIASGMPEPDPGDGSGPYWAPTVAADRFVETPTAARWHLLASTWFALPARPALIGNRAPDGKLFAALSDSLYSTAAPLDRRLLLTMLAALPPGAGVDSATAAPALIWHRPRWAARLQPATVADLLTEAHAVGLVGRGAITTPGRALLADEPEETVLAAMAKALPKPLDHFLLQADLTVVVPGPLERDLAEQLAAVADVESAGAAMVYRISEASIRRALDTGRTASELHSFFDKYSKTAVPQGLTYLVDDVARRHGQLRVGMAASFVRCEDPVLLAQAISSPASEQLDMRLLAPTVAVSQAPISDVLAGLRDAGLAPAAEDSTGTIVDIRARGARVTAPTRRRMHRPATAPTPQTLGAIVAVLRKVTAGPFANVKLDPATAITQLQEAAIAQTAVVIGYVDPAGIATQRVVAPINVRGGQLTAYDPAAGRVREFAIHRVTSVVPAEGADDPA